MSQITDLILNKVIARNNRRGKLVRKAVRMATTRRLEDKYTQELLKRVKFLRDITVSQLMPITKAVKEEVKIIRHDQDADELSDTIQSMRDQYNEQFNDTSNNLLAAEAAAAVSSFNLAQNKKVIKSIVGAEPIFPDTALNQQLRFFVRNNVALIKTIPTQYFDRVENAIFRNFSQGGRAAKNINEILPLVNKEIRTELKKAKNKAKLIATDQIQKLNGQLTQLRQTEVGINEYIWRTMQDERVRERHEEREGIKFKWTEPPSDGHPGEAINCRCFAEPVIKTSGIKFAA